jgi:hypothetical protein
MNAVTNTTVGPRAIVRDARRAILILASAVGVALGIFWALDAIMYPWAVSLTSPTLPGTWHGEVIMPAGNKQSLVLELRADDAGRHGNLKVLGASAQLCSTRGVREYDGFARPQGWRGTQFNMTLGATDSRPEGLAFIRLSAHWDQEDLIRAEAHFNSGGPQTIAVDRSGAITRPAASPDTLRAVSLTLRRGSARDTAAACARPGAQAH